MPRIKSDYECFDSGLLTLCASEERTITRAKMKHIRYGDRTVGIQRYYQAKVAGNKVDKVISIPMEVLQIEEIDTLDIVVLEGECGWDWDNIKFDDREVVDRTGQYQILQVQIKYDKKPQAIYLSLQKLLRPYADRRTDGENKDWTDVQTDHEGT